MSEEPHLLTEDVILGMLELVERYKGRADVDAVAPTVQWRASASTLKTANAGSDASFLAV